MKLTTFTLTPATIIVEKVEQRANDIINGFTHSIRKAIKAPDAVQIYSGLLNDLNTQWKLCVKHNIRYGRQLQSIYVDGCNRFTMAKFIADRFSFTVHNGEQFRRVNYTFDKFCEVAKMETAFLLAKYKEVYKFEVKIAVLTVLFRYFNLYSQNGYDDGFTWALEADDIFKCLNFLDGLDLKSLKLYADKIGDFVPSAKQQPIFKKPKPTCKDDIERCISDGMSQSDIAESIMDNWDVSRPTAYRLMKQYGFVRQQRKSEVAEHQKQPTSDNLENVQLQTLLVSKDYEIKKLKEEIERLKKELENQR